MKALISEYLYLTLLVSSPGPKRKLRICFFCRGLNRFLNEISEDLVEHVEAISRRSLRPWQRVVDDSGRPYWWHLTTRACQEERPEDWESRVDLPLGGLQV